MHRRLFAYLGLCVFTYAFFSYMDLPLLRFVLFFLLALPLISLAMLCLARHFVRWALRTEKEENMRVEEGRAVLSLMNLSFFFFPHITLYLDCPDESAGFIVTGAGGDEMKEREEWRQDEGHIPFRDLPGDLPPGELLKLNDNEYARTLENKWLRALSVPFRRFFVFPRFKKLRRSRRHVVYLAAYARYDWHFRYTPTHVGEYEIKASKLFARDFFGFFSLPLRQSRDADLVSSAHLSVLPNARYYRARFLHRLPEPQPSDFARPNNRLSNEINALGNIRPWRPGDRMKDIHFNVSSKQQSFFVKEYEDPRRGGILFLLDPYLPDSEIDPQDYYDELSEITASIIDEMNKGDGPLVLRFAEHSVEGPGGQKALRKFLHFLARQKMLPAEWRRAAERKNPKQHLSAAERTRFLAPRRRNRLLLFLTGLLPALLPRSPKRRTPSQTKKGGGTSLNESRILPSLTTMLRQEFKSEKYRGIIVISPSFTPLLAECMLQAARQKATRLVFVHLESPAEAERNTRAAEEIYGRESFSQTLRLRLNLSAKKADESEPPSEEEAKYEKMPLARRELYFRRLEALKVIIFHVSLDALGLTGKEASHLKVVSRSELRESLKRQRGSHYRPQTSALRRKALRQTKGKDTPGTEREQRLRRTAAAGADIDTSVRPPLAATPADPSRKNRKERSSRRV